MSAPAAPGFGRCSVVDQPTIDLLTFQLGRHVTNTYLYSSFELSSGTVTIRTNLIETPDLSAATTGWAFGGSPTQTATATGRRFVLTVALSAGGGAVVRQANLVPASPGDLASDIFGVTNHGASDIDMRAAIWPHNGTSNLTVTLGPIVTIPPGEFRLLATPATALPSGTTNVRAALVAGASTLPIGTDFEVSDGSALEKGVTSDRLISGSFPAAGDFEYVWSGTVNASTSIMRAQGLLGVSDPGVYQSQEWAAEGTKSAFVPDGKTLTVALAAASTVKVIARSPGQTMTVGGTPVTSVAADETLEAYGDTSVVLGPGWYDMLTIVAGVYTGPVFTADSIDWTDYTGSAQNISIHRGGAVTVDVGEMTAVLVRDDDPLADEAIRAGQPVRVVKYGTSTTLFTGVVQDAAVGIIRDGGGQVRNAITVTAVDAVASHSKNTRYGAVTAGGTGHETWAARITRLATSAETAVSLPSEPITPYAWDCQDVAYTSSLAAHFDLACQTVGANWFVGTDNVTRFRIPDDATTSVGTFSDQIAHPNQYDDILIDSGTKQVVNVLKITNHGRGDDGNTFDIATTFEDAVSVTAWGARAASTDMSVWDAGTMLSGRATNIFSAFANPVRDVTQLIWDGQQNPALAAILDIQSPITVRFGVETFETRIVELGHEIGPSSWTITITTSTRGVPASQAVNDAYASTPATGSEPINRDARPPMTPTGLTVTPFAAWQGGAIVLALDSEWAAVTTGDNGAPITIEQYEVHGRPNDGSTPAKLIGSTAGLSVPATDPAFASGDTWLVKVRARSENGVRSAFSTEVSVTLGVPAEELAAPTPLSVASRPGLAVAVWDGTLTTGAAPAFLQDVIVESALTSDAADEDWSVRGSLVAGGDAVQIAAPAGDSFYIRSRARDRLGRFSPPSTPALASIPAIPGGEIDIPSLSVALIQAGFAGQLDMTANSLIQLIVGQLGETRSVFRVTPAGAEVRQEGVAAYMALTALALQLYGPDGLVGAELTALGLETDLVKLNVLQFADFGRWEISPDGNHMSLKEL